MMLWNRNGPAVALPLMVAHCAGMLDMVALPVWVDALRTHYHLSLAASGSLVTAFFIGVATMSTAVSLHFDRMNPRGLAVGGFTLAASAFAFVAVRDALPDLALLHVLAGLGVGAGLSAVHGTIGRTPDPQRLFAAAGICLGAFAVAMLGTLPPLVQALGGPSMFLAFATVQASAAVVAALAFPNFGTGTAPGGTHLDRRSGAALDDLGPAVRSTILGICLITLTNAMVFSFVEVIGLGRGFPREDIATSLIAMGVANFALVAPAAMLLGKHLRPGRVVLVGPAVQAALAVAIARADWFVPWALAVTLFTGVQIFTHAFAFGLLARQDPTGRATAATPAMLMTGTALGPSLGGVLAEHFGFTAIGAAASLLAAAAIVAFARNGKVPAISSKLA